MKPSFCLRAKDIKEGQAVIYWADINGIKIDPPKILVKGNFGGGNGFSDVIPQITEKIPFSQIGVYKNDDTIFSPIPTDIICLNENQGLDVLKVGWCISSGPEENPFHYRP